MSSDLKIDKTMNKSVVFTPAVLNTLRSLPYEQRLEIASALTGELLLGAGESTDMQPEPSMIYSILRFYVKQASDRYNRTIWVADMRFAP